MEWGRGEGKIALEWHSRRPEKREKTKFSPHFGWRQPNYGIKANINSKRPVAAVKTKESSAIPTRRMERKVNKHAVLHTISGLYGWRAICDGLGRLLSCHCLFLFRANKKKVLRTIKQRRREGTTTTIHGHCFPPHLTVATSFLISLFSFGFSRGATQSLDEVRNWFLVNKFLFNNLLSNDYKEKREKGENGGARGVKQNFKY